MIYDKILSEKVKVFHQKKVLITGASGLIGFNLLSMLNKFIQEIKDVEITITSLNPVPEYIQNEIKELKYKYYSHEQFKKAYINSIECFDLIYHCAGYGQPIKFVENPFATVEVNTSDLVFVAKLLKTNGKMFYLSSSEIYTNCKVKKPSEHDIGTVRTDHERAIYIGSKLLGESICWNLRRLGKNIIILRVSLVFGPGTKLNDQRVLNELILRGIRNRKVNVLDDGSAIRNYLSAEQCIYWIVCLTNSNKNYIYNISGNHKLTIRELARLISEILEVKLEVGGKKALMAAPQLVEINNSRINSEYPVSDIENLKLKITEVIDWYRKIINV